MLCCDQMLYGYIDVVKLRKALKRYVSEHVLLNSHIQEINNELFWIKNNKISELEYVDFTIQPNNYKLNSNNLNSELLNYIKLKFDLYNEPLYRFKLIKIKESVYRFVVVFHHLVMDGISLNNGLFSELSNYYNNEHHVATYSIDDQIKLIANLTDIFLVKLEQNSKKYQEFWRQQLNNIENIDLKFLQLSNGKNKNGYESIKEIRFWHGYEKVKKLKYITHNYAITSYIYSLCIYAFILYKYTGQNNFVVCYPIAIKEGVEFIYGAQVNLNLMPFKITKNTTILDLFNQASYFLKVTTRDEIRYGYYPITNIIQEIGFDNKSLLNVYFAQAYFRDEALNFKGVDKVDKLLGLSIDGVTKDNLLFEQEPARDKLSYRVKFNAESVNEGLLVNFINIYKRFFSEILDDLLSNNIKSIADYSLLTKKQYRQIVYEWNKTEQKYPKNKTIHQLFEEQVLKTPNNVAVIFGDKKLTYQELNAKANQLAHYLLNRYQIEEDDLIALYLERSELMLIAILAALKTGGAYVPIETSYPDERIKYILDDTNTKIVLTNKEHKNRLLSIIGNIETLPIDAKETQDQLIKQNLVNPITATKSNNLIYVIYTSGTTGNPKGVMQQHDNVMRLFTATNDWYVFTANDTWTLFHSYAFDFSVWEIWGALIYGGKLIIPTKEQCIDTYAFYELCFKEQVTVLNQTPQAFYKFIDVAAKNFNASRLLDLRYVVFGGEALSYTNLLPWATLYGYNHPKLINMYGITETTVHVTYKEITKEDIGLSSNIGTVIPDQKIYILDDSLSPAPVGAIGELYVGGEGLARGYLNQSELTSTKFITNPFQTEEEKIQNLNSRLYKSGDLVRRLPDRSLEYIGRNDDQVKIRGFRIELGDIESKLLSYPAIKQAVVLVKNDTSNAIDKYIVAYYVSNQKLNETEIQNYLITQLPEYMLPRTIVYLDKLPLTNNGKLDKNALPEPTFEIDNKYIAPKNEREKLICDAFVRVLGIEKIGVNDDFFKLGGNSLKAITLTSILQANFEVKVMDIFNLRTPFNLAKELVIMKELIYKTLEQVKTKYHTKPIEERIIDEQLQHKITNYLNSISTLQFDYSLLKPISNVLLTGATGFLGCNLLNQLLQLTNYKIYLLIRAKSQEKAIERINQKFQFYFSKNLDDVLNTRVFILNADIEQPNLGLSPQEYRKLIEQVDSIIHCAALVKHYGEQKVFYSANVQSTINLLEFAKLTKLKDFHYVSTTGVLLLAKPVKNNKNIYIEDDLLDAKDVYDNVYVQTKLQGEYEVIKYRDYGVTSNIYRVGNLAFISENNRVQENIEENAFLTCIKFYLQTKSIAKEFDLVEISPADTTAIAILKLFDKKQLENNTYHVFNPHLSCISDVFSDENTIKIRALSLDKFIDHIIAYLSGNNYNDLYLRFLLHKGWIDGLSENSDNVHIMQDKTLYILKCLGFEWKQISKAMDLMYYLLKNEQKNIP